VSKLNKPRVARVTAKRRSRQFTPNKQRSRTHLHATLIDISVTWRTLELQTVLMPRSMTHRCTPWPCSFIVP